MRPQDADLSWAAFGTWLSLMEKGDAFFTIPGDWLSEQVRAWREALRPKWLEGHLFDDPDTLESELEAAGITEAVVQKAMGCRWESFPRLVQMLQEQSAAKAIKEGIIESTGKKAIERIEILQTAIDSSRRILGQKEPKLLSTLALDDVLRPADLIPTGMEMDKTAGGFEIGCLSLLYGLTGCGKSTLSYQWAVTAAKAGHPVCIFSTEMEESDILRRILSSMAGVSLFDIRMGKADARRGDLALAKDALSALPLRVRSVRGWTCQEIEPLIMREGEAGRARFAIVDHISGLRLGGDDGKFMRQADNLQRVVLRLRDASKKAGAALLCVGHLNRQAQAAKTAGEEQGLEFAAVSYAANFEADLSLVLQSRILDGGRANRVLTIAKARHSREGVSLPLVYDGDRATFTDADLVGRS